MICSGTQKILNPLFCCTWWLCLCITQCKNGSEVPLEFGVGHSELVCKRGIERSSLNLSSWKTSVIAIFFNYKEFSSKKLFNKNKNYLWNHIDFIFLLKILKSFGIYFVHISDFSGIDLLFPLIFSSFCKCLSLRVRKKGRKLFTKSSVKAQPAQPGEFKKVWVSS